MSAHAKTVEPAPKPRPTTTTASFFALVRRADSGKIISVIKAGLPYGVVEQLCAELDIPATRLAKVIQIAPATLARRKQGGVLTVTESERAARLAALFERAVQLFDGDRLRARRWMHTPQKALGGVLPLDYADTEPGANAVRDLIGRLEHGVFA
ncbi:MAG: DUF2384 domain-containing protein [Gammaproteobacteria bacterium]|nr:DUF2384 domain-containing protein [Gammaproteobacteria bacterium]